MAGIAKLLLKESEGTSLQGVIYEIMEIMNGPTFLIMGLENALRDALIFQDPSSLTCQGFLIIRILLKLDIRQRDFLMVLFHTHICPRSYLY